MVHPKCYLFLKKKAYGMKYIYDVVDELAAILETGRS